MIGQHPVGHVGRLVQCALNHTGGDSCTTGKVRAVFLYFACLHLIRLRIIGDSLDVVHDRCEDVSVII